MLEGLEITEYRFSHIPFNNEVFRYDAEYFKKSHLLLDSAIRNGNHFVVEENFDVSKLAGFEFTKFFTPSNMCSSDSYIALTSKNIQQNELNLNEYITIDKYVADTFLIRSKIYRNDIVLSYTGEYRRALVMLEDNYQLGPNICRIRPLTNFDINSCYVSVFLNCKYGQQLLDREKTLSAQPTVAMSRIRKLPVPILDSKLQELISLKYIKANELRSEAEKIFNEAERFLSKTLGLADFTFNSNTTSVKTYKESFLSSGRFDAEYYQPKYEDYYNLVCQYENGYKSIGNICQIKDKNVIPEGNEEYSYIELADVGKTGLILDSSKMLGVDLPSRARRVVHTGDIVISSLEGSLDSCAYISEDYDGSLCSTGFYVIKSDVINPETLLILFKSLPIQQLIKRGCSGTIMSAISRAELDTIPLPLIVKDIQIEIANLVQKSFALRKEAKQLLDEAKRIVEDSISSSINN